MSENKDDHYKVRTKDEQTKTDFAFTVIKDPKTNQLFSLRIEVAGLEGVVVALTRERVKDVHMAMSAILSAEQKGKLDNWFEEYVLLSGPQPTKLPGLDASYFVDPNSTSEDVNGEILVIGDGESYGGVGAPLTATLFWYPVRLPRPAQELGVDAVYPLYIREIDPQTGDVLQQAKGMIGSDGFIMDPSGPHISGTMDYKSGVVTRFRFERPPAKGNPIKVFYTFDQEAHRKVNAGVLVARPKT